MDESSLCRIFKTLCLVFQKYSQLPVRQLMDYKLRVKIIYPLRKQFLALFQIQQYQLKLLRANNWGYALIVIDHGLTVNNLAYTILENISDCLIIEGNSYEQQKRLDREDQQKQTEGSNSLQEADKNRKYQQFNNLLYSFANLKSKDHQVRAILLPIRAKIQKQFLYAQLKWFLSLMELFFAHLHIQLYSFAVDTTEGVKCILNARSSEEQEQDQQVFELIPQDAYIKILQQRASKITISQLKQLGEVQLREWGKLILFQQGIDSLVLWVTIDELPILSQLPQLAFKHSKQIVQIFRSELGYTIFKHKKRKQLIYRQIHDRAQELQLTVCILDFSSKLMLNKEKVLDIVRIEMQPILDLFYQQSRSSQSLERTNQYIDSAEKISELLEVDPVHLLVRVFKL